MQLRKALDEVPAVLRVIISGTPIQNNMMEMWALLNFCVPDVLGEAADFRQGEAWGGGAASFPAAPIVQPWLGRLAGWLPACLPAWHHHAEPPPWCASRDKFEKVITVGTDKHATEYERERGAVAAARLRQVRGWCRQWELAGSQEACVA